MTAETNFEYTVDLEPGQDDLPEEEVQMEEGGHLSILYCRLRYDDQRLLSRSRHPENKVYCHETQGTRLFLC
jgi:hypothetical protein